MRSAPAGGALDAHGRAAGRTAHLVRHRPDAADRWPAGYAGRPLRRSPRPRRRPARWCGRRGPPRCRARSERRCRAATPRWARCPWPPPPGPRRSTRRCPGARVPHGPRHRSRPHRARCGYSTRGCANNSATRRPASASTICESRCGEATTTVTAHAARQERLADLQAHVAAAQHHGAAARSGEARDLLQIFEVAQAEHAREVRAGNGELRAARAGGDDERVEGQLGSVVENRSSDPERPPAIWHSGRTSASPPSARTGPERPTSPDTLARASRSATGSTTPAST